MPLEVDSFDAYKSTLIDVTMYIVTLIDVTTYIV